MNRKISIILMLILVFQSVFIAPLNMSYASTNRTDRYDQPRWFDTDPLAGQTWDEYKNTYGLPMETPRVNQNGYTFSMEHWMDKRIIVYGGPDDVPKNDFKKATRVDGTEVPIQGYYENGTGEYRYHGFDGVGNPYNNNNFPRDANSGTLPSDKNWIYRIWDDGSPYKFRPNGTERIAEASMYNKTAMRSGNGQTEVKTRNWINDGLPFELNRSTNSNKDAFNYAQVLTRPTTLFPGETVLWHISDYDKQPWYQSFSLNKIEDKAPTPVEAEIFIRSISDRAIDTSAAIVIKGTIKGTLQDAHMYDGLDEEGIPDDVLRGAFYNREDIDSWSFKIRDQITGLEQTITGKRELEGVGSAEFTITIPYHAYEGLVSLENPELGIVLTGSATSHFHTGDTATGHATTADGVSGSPELPGEPPSLEVSAPLPVEKEPLIMDISAPKEMLDTERFNLWDNTVGTEGATREIRLSGQLLSESEAESFARGQHLFSLLGEDKIYTYSIKYTDKDGIEDEYIGYVVVYTTKPKAQFKVTGTFKENRLIEANTDIASVNSSYLRANASIGTDLFTAQNLEGSNTIIKYGTNNASKLAYIVKGQTAIGMQMRVTTSVPGSKIERSDIPSGYFTSDVYTYKLFVLEDHKPALIANIWNSVLTRNETIDFYYDAASVDEDILSISTYKIYYDADGNGTPEKLIKQGNYADYTDFTPTELGYYKIVFYAEETFGQPTLSQFITSTDKRTATIEREFYVDNLAPMTKIYTDIEYDFPEADVMVLNDQAVTRELNNTIVSERVNWINGLRQSGIAANVEVWDLHTYIYSQSASTTRNTGTSYPPSTRSYSSGGYSGTLSRYDVVNNRYRQDDGGYVTVTESQTFTASHSNTVSSWGTYGEKGWSSNESESSPAPSSKYISSNGYSGSIPRTGTSQTYDSGTDYDESTWTWKRKQTYKAHYSGTLTKSATVWESDYNWYDDYTGYYSGTIYKNVKQTFTPTFRNGSDKYIVYFADSAVNNKPDIQSVLNKGDARTILVSKSTARSQVSHSYWVDGTQSLENIMKAVNDIIKENNPVDNRKLLLIGQTFETNVANFDMEGDPLSVIGFQYVQDANYYDNSMGIETGTRTSYSDTAFSSTVKSSFSKAGKYTIHRMIKDSPVGKASFGKTSNVPALDVYAHRKPIADFTLDWDYSPSDQKYRTTWVDLSYDLDHQFRDAEKGIRERQIMYRKTDGDNQWIYRVPDNLSPGTYELRYIVKDIEGVWSDPKTKTFTLSPEPEIELYGKVSPSVIPASETLTIYDIKSKYHRHHVIQVDTLTGTIQLDTSNKSTYSQVDTWYFWTPIIHNIPQNTKDGIYEIVMESQGVVRKMPFRVVTPIYITGSASPLLAGEVGVFTAVAGKYASEVDLVLYRGSSFEKTIPMNRSGINASGESLWEISDLVPETLDEGTYGFLFIAKTPSEKEATDLISAKVDVLKIDEFTIEGYWNHWRGQKNIFGEIMTMNPHRFLSYEKLRIKAWVVGNPESVSVDVSEKLKAMTYRDGSGNLYRYRDEFGEDVVFPLHLQETSDGYWYGEYIVPLTGMTLDWENDRIHPPYEMILEVVKGTVMKQEKIADIEVTGNVYDLIHLQPDFGSN